MAKKYKHALCTLFNSVYADKGIVLYKSLEKVTKDFTLYVLAMDDICFNVLKDLNYKHLIPLRLDDFENEELVNAKNNRPFGQYCWTCSSSLIKYILDTYNPDYCTYIDADMAFYHDPYIFIEELERRNAQVSFMSHRFNKYDKHREFLAGHFCVECNTFKNTQKSKEILHHWISLCIEDCSIKEDGVHWGDQKYLDLIFSKYEGIIESDLLGAGVAPWNINQYKEVKIGAAGNTMIISKKGLIEPLIFYHYERIMCLPNGGYNINVFSKWGIRKKLIKALYIPYLQDILEAKQLLISRYNLDTTIITHPAINTRHKESYGKKILRVLKMIISLDVLDWYYHTLPIHIYGKNNIINL